MDLSIYNNSDFDRGAPRWKEALWVFARGLFFPKCLALAVQSAPRLLELFGAKIGKRVIIRGT